MEVIILGCIAIAAILGLLIGFGKGFTRVNSWGLEFVIAAAIVLAVGGVVKSNNMEGIVPGVLMLGLTVGSLIVLKILSAALRGLFRGGKKRKLARAEVADVADDSGLNDVVEDDSAFDLEGDDGLNDPMDGEDLEILQNGITSSPKEKKGRKNRKIYNEELRGACGFVDRLFGAVALAVKGAVIVTLIVSLLLVLCDLIQLDAVTSVLKSIYDGNLWGMIKPRVMDLFVVAIVFLCVKTGYSSGFSQTLWSIIVIALFIGAGFVSWNLAFNSQSFAPAAEALSTHLASLSFMETISGFISTLTIAKSILTVGVFIILVIVIMILRAFVPRIISWARDSSVVYFIDGVFGAVFATAFVTAIVMLLGYALQPISDLELLAEFTSYFTESNLACYFYGNNIVLAAGILPELPIREWLV